jgi:hypothetical protein
MTDLAAKTPDGVKARAMVMHDVMAVVQAVMENLYARWAEEKQHEDFNEYAEVLKKACPVGVEFVKATKSPFGMVIKPAGFPYSVQLLVNSKNFGWKVCK